MLTKILAQVCRLCPACILRRRYPESGFAKVMRSAEKGCPFCRAYDRLYGAGDASQEQAQ
ncbi:MAG: hypothetical protein JXR94_23915 [Candidatus Hydrogenedentes bacterium]|nr:hypothetical protein [Candidatus Hydrogenedentota bacterium]